MRPLAHRLSLVHPIMGFGDVAYSRRAEARVPVWFCPVTTGSGGLATTSVLHSTAKFLEAWSGV